MGIRSIETIPLVNSKWTALAGMIVAMIGFKRA